MASVNAGVIHSEENKSGVLASRLLSGVDVSTDWVLLSFGKKMEKK
jgi:hypothetical protein